MPTTFLPLYIYFFKCWHRLNEPAQHLDIPSASPGGGQQCPLVVGMSGHSTDPQTIVGNEFGECHAPYTLKISYIDFEKGYTHCSRYKRLHFKILHNSPFLSSGSQKTLSHSSFISVELVLVLNMHEILELDVKQTINLPNTFLISFTNSSEPVTEMKLYMV